MILRPLIALPLLALAAAAPPPPPPGPVGTTADADARCIALLSQMLSKGTPQQKGAAQLSMMYYVGKLRGRNPNVNFAAALKAGADAGTRQKLAPQAEIQRCGAEVSGSADALRGVPTMGPPARK